MTAGPLAALPVPGLVGGAADLVLQVAPAAVDAARDAVAGWLALLRGPLAGTAADAWARLAPALAALGPLTAVAGAIRSCRHVFVHARSDGARTHLFGEPDDEPLRSEPVSRPRCSGPPSSHRHVEAGPRSRTAPRPERANGVPVGHAVVWAGEDSNLRRQCRQIYSLLPLSARAPTRGGNTLAPAAPPPPHGTGLHDRR
jgi:hypothetical protein